MMQELMDIVEEAGEEVLKIYEHADFSIQTKDDKENSPLTTADMRSNEIIVHGLRNISDYPIVSEESVVPPYEERRYWGKFWLVDPLDGTKNFIAKDEEFTINIALLERSKPVVGIVYAPALKMMYWAEKGKGAFLGGEKIRNTSKRKDLIGALSRFHATEADRAFFQRYHITVVKTYGSALKICKLAEGDIDVYPRFNGTREWDTAAPHIIAKEAGCKLIDVKTNQEIMYNKEDMKNNYFIASRMDLDFSASGNI